MTEPKETTLVARVRALVGYDDTYARDAIREIAKWLEEDGSHCGPRCAFRLEQQAENYDDWDVEPSQEGFESYVLDEIFFDAICEDVRGKGNPMRYTKVEQLGDVEIDFDWEDEE